MLAEILKALREQSELTKKQIALELKLPYSTYNHYEIGEREPGIEVLRKIAEFYNISADVLIAPKLDIKKIPVNDEEEELIKLYARSKNKDRLMQFVKVIIENEEGNNLG